MRAEVKTEDGVTVNQVGGDLVAMSKTARYTVGVFAPDKDIVMLRLDFAAAWMVILGETVV